MFSSDNNNNNSLPLFYHHQSPSFSNVIPESNNILFQQYHGKLLPSTYLPIWDNSIVNLSSEPSINQQDSTIVCPYSNVTINRMSSSSRPAGKKDRHTKITTAQGVRDRRVRLSMSIAREFFNLQDMLGFDKASKTLGWLLVKSKAAIDEVASTSNFKFIGLPNEKEDHQQEDDNDDVSKICLDEKSSSKNEKRKRRENNHLVKNGRNVFKETKRREEARKRARERTRNKKKIVDDHHHNNHPQPLHQMVQQDFMICQSNNSASTLINNNLPSYGLISKEGTSTVRESVVIKANHKSRESSYNYNYEMINSKDDQESCNYYNDYVNKSAPETCNYGGIIQPPGFPALNIINLSTEIHINARPWDTYNNQILH